MPVLHYCMGGVTITPQGEVLNENKKIILGLHAVGEVTGGVHGSNWLGSNLLLECALFGSIVGQAIPIHAVTPEQYKKYPENASSHIEQEVPLSEISIPELK